MSILASVPARGAEADIQKQVHIKSSTLHKLEPVPATKKITNLKPEAVRQQKVQPDVGKVKDTNPKNAKKAVPVPKTVKVHKVKPPVKKAPVVVTSGKKTGTPSQSKQSTAKPIKATAPASQQRIVKKMGVKNKPTPAKRISIHPTLMTRTKGKPKSNVSTMKLSSQAKGRNSISKKTLS